MLARLNSKHPTIQFEMEVLDENQFLPILDISVKINDDGRVEHKLYTKPASKGITLHFLSYHPQATKCAVAQYEFKRAIQCSTSEHRREALETTRAKLKANGYPANWLSGPSTVRKNKRDKPRFSFNLPFISDKFNRSVRQLLSKHRIDARVVNPRGRTLLSLVQTDPANRPKKQCPGKLRCPAPNICQRCNIVYRATCAICGHQYIGMTTRTLHERAREHLNAAKNRSPSSAFGEHYDVKHPSAHPNIDFEIVEWQPDDLRLHIAEAMAIQRSKPELNRRIEDTGTGFLV